MKCIYACCRVFIAKVSLPSSRKMLLFPQLVQNYDISGDKFATTPKSYVSNFLTVRPPTPCMSTSTIPSSPKFKLARSSKRARRSLFSRRTNEWPRMRTFGTCVEVVAIITNYLTVCYRILSSNKNF